MINLYTPIWSNLKMKEKRPLREKCYTDTIMQTITSMFVYNHNVKDTIFKRAVELRLEELLRLYGKVAFFKDDNNNLKFGRCHFINGKSEIDWSGCSNGVIITTLDGETYEREIGADCVVMYNNNMGRSELNIFRYVEQLAEVDISQIDLLINARSHPIIVAPNDKIAEIIKTAIKNSKDGVPITIANNSKLVNGMNGVDANIDVVSATDPKTAELFQYYSHYHLDLMGRLYGLYGLTTFNTGKMAQTNNLEVSGTLASSMVIPINNYRARQIACDEISKMFDIEFSVEFGECWKNQLSMLQGIEKDDYNIDESESDTNGDGIVNDNDVVKETNGNEQENVES